MACHLISTSSCLLIIYFAAVAFTSYGAFWLSFATLFIPNSGIADAYSADPGMEQDAIGIYLLSWMIVTFLFLWVIHSYHTGAFLTMPC